MPLNHPPNESGSATDPARGEFERQVCDALDHLYDPVYLQNHPLTRFVQLDPSRSDRPDRNSHLPSLGRALSQSLLDAIEALRPVSAPAQSPRAARTHQILRLRFVEALEVSEIESRLAMSRSAYYVEQQRAVKAVAAVLWGNWVTGHVDRSSQPSRPVDRGVLPQHNLPLSLTSFVGREREMAEIRRLLGTTRLLTLTGSGGCGKTRLAFQTASGSLGEYPDGVWLVELASLADPTLVPQVVASSLGLREEPGRAILDTLLDYLRMKRLLLVLDNCEHLVDACASLADSLLRGCASVQILATSREALGIAGEDTFRVPSLSLPDIRHLPTPPTIASFEAVRLFVDRASAIQPGFCLAESNALAVSQICCRLDGIPLAIELAAARIRGLSPDQIASRLDDRFHLLTSGSRTALPRQQTLRATIDWSHDLLSAPEKALFRRLAVFAGSWTLDAAEVVCTGDNHGASIDRADILDLVLRLLDRSLLGAEQHGGEVRYHLLETIRQYAQEKLAESEEAAPTRDHHLEWCVALADRVEPEWWGPRQVRWLDRFELEQGNLRAALEWSLDRNPELGLRLLASVWHFWALKLDVRIGEGCRWLDLFLTRVPENTIARARALHGVAFLTRVRGDPSRARALAEEGLLLCRALGDAVLTSRAINFLAGITLDSGDLAGALSLHQEGLALSRAAKDRLGIGMGLLDLGQDLKYLGDRDQARVFFEGSLGVLREAGDNWNLSWTLRALADLYREDGDRDRARPLFEESLALSREIGFKAGAAYALVGLGHLARDDGDLRRSEELLREGVALGVESANWWARTLGLSAFGLLDLARGACERGVRLVAAASVHKPFEETLWLIQGAENEPALTAAREALGEEAFARAWVEGQAMTLEKAVEYALQGEADA